MAKKKRKFLDKWDFILILLMVSLGFGIYFTYLSDTAFSRTLNDIFGYSFFALFGGTVVKKIVEPLMKKANK